MSDDQKTLLMRFGQRLRDQRIACGYATARDFASALGIRENTYTRYERGKSEPSLDMIEKICRKLRISVSDLLDARDTVLAAGMYEDARPYDPSRSMTIAPREASAAWRIAELFAASDIASPPADDKLSNLVRVAQISQRLMSAPHHTISEILPFVDLELLAPAARDELSGLLYRFLRGSAD